MPAGAAVAGESPEVSLYDFIVDLTDDLDDSVLLLPPVPPLPSPLLSRFLLPPPPPPPFPPPLPPPPPPPFATTFPPPPPPQSRTPKRQRTSGPPSTPRRIHPPASDASPSAHDDFVKQVRAYFKLRFDATKENGGRKPDMTAWGDCKKVFEIPRVHGHIPGVSVGDTFSGRGEAAAVGVHNMMMQGIDYANKSDDGSHEKGAYAVCLGGSGNSKMQVRNQEMSKGNLALYRNFEKGTPVRLLRGKRDAFTNLITYVYDGLYNVVSYTFEASVASAQGTGAIGEVAPRVFKFKLLPVKGESKVSFLAPSFKRIGARFIERFVNAKIDKTTNMRKEILAAANDQSVEEPASPEPDWATVVVMDDLSKGAEPYPIRVVNDTGDGDLVGFKPLDVPFTYVATSVQGVEAKRSPTPISQRARETISKVAAATAQMDEKREDSHRRAFGTHHVNAVPSRRAYSLDGLLKQSSEEGLVETWDDGDAKHARAATGGDAGMTFHAHNESAFTARCIHHGLEVYKVSKEKGWGLRCRERILAGAYVCDYVGEVCLDSEREENSPELLSDEYIMSLDHYIHATEDNARMLLATTKMKEPAAVAAPAPYILYDLTGEDEDCENQVARAMPPPAPAASAADASTSTATTTKSPVEALEDYLLCLDAYKYGNVARYINTSDKESTNLILQPIFTSVVSSQASASGGAPDPSSMQFYRVALFATRDIAPLEELLYDYGDDYWVRLRKGDIRTSS
ncbi:histone-lysine N-methyltransferase, H3 lysine-9 specific [Pycnococcus provasolii]